MSAEQKLREAIARQIERETIARRMQIEHSNSQTVQAITSAFERLTDPLENTGVVTVSTDDAPSVQLETVFDHPDVSEILDACKLNGIILELRPSTGGQFRCVFSVSSRFFSIAHSDSAYKKNPLR
jgi:hypothetical protein